MENLPDKPQPNQGLDLMMFMKKTFQIGFIILIFGAVYILLDKLDLVTDQVTSFEPNPWSIVGGGIVIFALTLMGVPVIPAIVAGGTIGFIINKFFFHN